MSDDMPVVFGMGDARRIDRSTNAWERMVEGWPSQRKPWRQPVDEGDSSGGGGTGGGGCSCCDCTQCLNMCTQDGNDVITTCSNCDAAPRKFSVYFGSVIGTQQFVYSSGCEWVTANFNVTYTYPGPGGSDTGVYKAVLLQGGVGSTIEVLYVSGTDCLKLSSGYRQLKWKADPDKQYSCTCNMTFIPAVPPHRFPPNLFVGCETCLAPVATEHVACSATSCNEQHCYAIAWPGADLTSLLPAGYTFTIDPATARTFTVYGPTAGTGDTCIWQWESKANGGAVTGYALSASLTYGPPGSFIIYWPTEHAGPIYSFITGTYDSPGGASCATPGTFTRHSGVDTHWPATIAVTATADCTFGATHYDYGYGCGGGSDTTCTGLCPAVSAVGTSPTGFVWTFSGAPASNCVGASCICQTIDQITALFGYPSGLGATAEAPCVNS